MKLKKMLARQALMLILGATFFLVVNETREDIPNIYIWFFSTCNFLYVYLGTFE